MNFKPLLGLLVFLTLTSCNQEKKSLKVNTVAKEDPLPSWNESASKTAIISYVNDVTNDNSQNFIPIADRIATFDNDGTLWSEKPAYFQLFFAIDRVKELAKNHPEWKTEQPFKAVLDNDMEELTKQGNFGLMTLLKASRASCKTLLVSRYGTL